MSVHRLAGSAARRVQTFRVSCYGRSVRGVIFDLDGTLVDSLDDITAALNHVLQARGYALQDRETVEQLVGDGARMLVRRALPAGARDEEVLAAFRARYAAHALRHTRPFLGIPELLASLRRRRVPTAVLSNKPHDITLQVVRGSFPDHPFAAVLGQRDGHPTKPDPGAAQEIAAMLGATPIALVGDSPVDIMTAQSSGLVPIGVSWGMRPAALLHEAGAHAVLDQPADLVEIVETGLGSR